MRKRRTLDVSPAVAQRVTDLKLHLMAVHPFWGYLLGEVRILWEPRLPTLAGTDGICRIWLHPTAIAHLDRRQLGFVLLHELGHIVLDTVGRQTWRDRTLWNQATDYAINRQVATIARRDRPNEPAWTVPRGDILGLGPCEPLLDPRFDHLGAEVIYDRLHQLGRPSQGGDSTEVEDENGDQVRSDPDHGGGLDIHLAPTGGAAAQTQERDRAVQRLHEACEVAKRFDRNVNLPLGVDRWLAKLHAPKLSWRALLQRHLSELGAAVERSWAHPHKRWLADDLLVPGPLRDNDGTVVVAVDTSGSMATDRLHAIASELQPLHDTVADLWLVTADAAVQDVVPPGKLQDFLARRRFGGGGGTDHRPVFEWVAQMGLRPQLLVACTDMRTVLPKRRPPYPVLWLVLPDDQGRRGPRSPFGEEVTVSLYTGSR